MRMERLDGVGELYQQEGDLPRCESRTAELIERLALDVRERDERVAQRLVDAQHRNDRGMVERLEASRFGEEVTPRIRIARVAKDLQRDGAIARFVVCTPDVGRATGADVRREAVAAGHDRADVATGSRQDLGDVGTPHKATNGRPGGALRPRLTGQYDRTPCPSSSQGENPLQPP